MNAKDIDTLQWDKGSGLLPLIVQHAGTGTVLMTGFVNREAVALMLERRQVVLYSRSRKRIWIKGESSGHYIKVQEVIPDCDRDALLVLGTPSGPTCHAGTPSCFPGGEPSATRLAFLDDLQRTIDDRISSPPTDSYTAALVARGIQRIAQKVGEEALEVALAAASSRNDLCSESADLLFHLLVLLRVRGIDFGEIVSTLRQRQQVRSNGQTARRLAQAIHG